jgi:hypothetical protein
MVLFYFYDPIRRKSLKLGAIHSSLRGAKPSFCFAHSFDATLFKTKAALGAPPVVIPSMPRRIWVQDWVQLEK